MFTAGKFKRTVTMLTEATDEDKAKFQEQLEEIHVAFREHVAGNRASLDVDQVATGEAWLGVQALEKGLVDRLMTSDEYLRGQMRETDVIQVKLEKKKKSFKEMLTQGLEETKAAIEGAVGQIGMIGGTSRLHDAKFEDVNQLHNLGRQTHTR